MIRMYTLSSQSALRCNYYMLCTEIGAHYTGEKLRIAKFFVRGKRGETLSFKSSQNSWCLKFLLSLLTEMSIDLTGKHQVKEMFRFVLASCKEMLGSSCEDRRDVVWSRLPTTRLKTLEVSSLFSASSVQHYLLRIMLTDIVLSVLDTCRQSRRPAEGGQWWQLCGGQSWRFNVNVARKVTLISGKLIHHHYHVHEALGMFPVPWSSRWSWSLHLFLGRPMFLRPFGLYCSACFGSLFVSILCTCCSQFFWL